ncbi:hypothetical protein [Facilibium subflavum]|uniref:hypothetical protein n=1 Tax=Facilibium subflavum TaxID=2219058 RepID=UPI000E6560A4|nr:hypothetical protein [Facilibium subflavum]
MSNFVHFYWAGGKIPYMVKKNIIHWAQHLKDTEFVPVLWTNDSVFKEMQTQIESEKNKATLTIGDPVYHLLVKENNIKRNTIEKLNKITDLKSEGKLLWKPHSSLLDSGRSCYIIIINAETYLNEIANRDNSGKVLKENVESIKLCYQLANENKLFALMKDKFIPFIISHFGGFYFDADIKPKLETAFFKNMADVIGLDTNNKMEFNVLGGKNPLLYKLLKFDNDDDTPGVLDKSNVLHEDVGFYFCPNPTKIKDPSGNYIKFLESDTEKLSLLKDFKEGLDRYTELSKLKKDQNKEKGILDISKEWIDCYGQDKYDAAFNLYEKSGSLVINEDSIEKMLYECAKQS